MTDFTAADFGGMAQGEQEFMAIFNTLTNTLTDLQHKLESSLSQWTGGAQAAYHQAKAQWDQAAQHMALVLNQLGVTIGQANQTYQDTERQLSGLWEG